jgi:tape measure domain-containing protein
MANLVEFIYKLTDQVSGTLKKVAENSARAQAQMEKTQTSVNKIGQSLVKFGAAYIGIQQAIRGGKAFVQLGLDMEQTRAKFEVLLGSMEKGNKMIAEIQDYSASSVFDQGTLARNAETLLGFNVEAGKTVDVLKMIGDISMGDKQRMSSLTLAFAQMSSAGRLTGQDLLQMINAGFNPLSEISVKTGKSLVDLRKDMEAGVISSQMVEDAFRSATSEGGKFYGMMEKMSESGQGKITKMLGIFQNKLTEFSERLSPVIAKIADFGIVVVNNFDNILAAVSALLLPVRALLNGLDAIGQFAVNYKAAFVAITIALIGLKLAFWQATLATKGWTIASMLQYKWLLLVERAQKLLNATVVKNPFGVLLVAVTAVVGGLVMLNKRTKEVTNAQRQQIVSAKTLLEINNAAAKNSQDELTRLKLLYEATQDLTKSQESRIAAAKELVRLYPETFKGLTTEQILAGNAKLAYDQLTASIYRKAYVEAVGESLKKAEQEIIDAEAGREQQIQQIYSDIDDGTIISAFKGDIGKKEAVKARRKELDAPVKAAEIKRDAIAKLVTDLSDNELKKILGISDPITPYNFDGNSNTDTDISSLTGAGSKPTNININFRNLIEFLNMYPQTLKEGVSEVSDELIEGLLRVVNSANKIPAR